MSDYGSLVLLTVLFFFSLDKVLAYLPSLLLVHRAATLTRSGRSSWTLLVSLMSSWRTQTRLTSSTILWRSMAASRRPTGNWKQPKIWVPHLLLPAMGLHPHQGVVPTLAAGVSLPLHRVIAAILVVKETYQLLHLLPLLVRLNCVPSL